jgi:hypothetical protein
MAFGTRHYDSVACRAGVKNSGQLSHREVSGHGMAKTQRIFGARTRLKVFQQL